MSRSAVRLGSVSSGVQESLTILVVEDEFLIAEEMTTMLENAGHAVLGPAGSVHAAEALLADAPAPNVAVIDANLRGETSAPLAASLRDRAIPFCVCTGYRIADLKALFGDVVKEPPDGEHRAVGGRRLLQEQVDVGREERQ